MEEPEQRPGGCFDRPFSALTVDDVYKIAKAIGTDVEKLIDACGKESVVGLVTKTVKVLELLESFASRNNAHKLREDELLKTFETIQLQQQKKRLGKEAEDGNDEHETRVRRAAAARSARGISRDRLRVSYSSVITICCAEIQDRYSPNIQETTGANMLDVHGGAL